MKYFVATIGGATAIMLLFYFADQGVLGMAAQYADDEPKLIKFMSDMGYPKTGEWCGEFAASVIKRAGGTPPSGAAIASNWRGYGTPDVTPHVGDVAVADRGVPTGATGSHVGFVTDLDLSNGTFTLESGNSSKIYTTRKIGCFSFHTPPNNVLSVLIGNGVPSVTAIDTAAGRLPLSRASIGAYPFAPAILQPEPDDCAQGGLDTDNYNETSTPASGT
jgi:CHAP domain